MALMILRSHQATSHVIRAHRPMELNRFVFHEHGLLSMIRFYERLGYITEDILSRPALRKLNEFKKAHS